jgi:hypothetical protein
MDNYLFRGFTERTREDRGNFYFSRVGRSSYPATPMTSMGVRIATSASCGKAVGIWRTGSDKGESAIRYVRGRFRLGLARRESGGRSISLLPGNAILSTLHDPVAGPLTNTFIHGTFKGKLNDWDGDGRIDLNSRNVYSTAEGELDTNMDGIPDEPGVACCTRRDRFPL